MLSDQRYTASLSRGGADTSVTDRLIFIDPRCALGSGFYNNLQMVVDGNIPKINFQYSYLKTSLCEILVGDGHAIYLQPAVAYSFKIAISSDT